MLKTGRIDPRVHFALSYGHAHTPRAPAPSKRRTALLLQYSPRRLRFSQCALHLRAPSPTATRSTRGLAAAATGS